MFLISGSFVLLIIPHKALLSDCDCFSFRSLIYMFMKWICFIKFSTYSSYILRLGLRPKPEAVMFYLVVMPSTLRIWLYIWRRLMSFWDWLICAYFKWKSKFIIFYFGNCMIWENQITISIFVPYTFLVSIILYHLFKLFLNGKKVTSISNKGA
jgi:hypothetical protein